MELCFPLLMMAFEGCGLHTFFGVTGDGRSRWNGGMGFTST